MSRAARVSKAEIARIISGMKAAGETVGRVEVEPSGKVTILTGAPAATLTPLEQARARRAERAAQGT